MVLLVPLAGIQAQPAALVVVDEVVEQQYTRTVPVLGRLVAKQSGNVASRIRGAVSEVLVQVGDSAGGHSARFITPPNQGF